MANNNNNNKNNKTFHNDGYFLTHSLVGSTAGNNTPQNLVNILNQTTRPSSSVSANQTKKVGE